MRGICSICWFIPQMFPGLRQEPRRSSWSPTREARTQALATLSAVLQVYYQECCIRSRGARTWSSTSIWCVTCLRKCWTMSSLLIFRSWKVQGLGFWQLPWTSALPPGHPQSSPPQATTGLLTWRTVWRWTPLCVGRNILCSCLWV